MMHTMTYDEKLDYVLNLFIISKIDMQLSMINGLLPQHIKPEKTKY
jgi:hypothetical protein